MDKDKLPGFEFSEAGESKEGVKLSDLEFTPANFKAELTKAIVPLSERKGQEWAELIEGLVNTRLTVSLLRKIGLGEEKTNELSQRLGMKSFEKIKGKTNAETAERLVDAMKDAEEIEDVVYSKFVIEEEKKGTLQ